MPINVMIALLIVGGAILWNAIYIIPEYEKAVIFRLGRIIGAKGPGLFFVIPGVDRVVRMGLRTITLDVPVQEIITKDNVPCKVNAVCYFRVMDPVRAVVEIQDYILATSQISQTTLRSVLGQVEFDELLGKREHINTQLQKIIDQQTDPWGVKVSIVEIKDVQIPDQMLRSISHQAEAERDRRAKVINSEGEFQAAKKLAEAAKIIAEQPMSMQLRFLQTATEIAADKNSTLVFPIPIEMLKAMNAMGEKKKG